MSAFAVDISELTALTRKFAGAEPVVKRNLNKAGRTAGFIVEGNAKVEAPVKTGNLKNKIGPPSVKQSGIATTVEVKAHAAYAYIVHEGRGVVVPVRAKALRWVGPQGVVFSMRSGPVAPNRFMDRGLAKSEAQINQAFDQALTNTLRELGLT